MIIYFLAAILDAILNFSKTLNGAKSAPDEILKSNVSPLRKYQNIYYTLPCHVRLKYNIYVPDYMDCAIKKDKIVLVVPPFSSSVPSPTPFFPETALSK